MKMIERGLRAEYRPTVMLQFDTVYYMLPCKDAWDNFGREHTEAIRALLSVGRADDAPKDIMKAKSTIDAGLLSPSLAFIGACLRQVFSRAQVGVCATSFYGVEGRYRLMSKEGHFRVTAPNCPDVFPENTSSFLQALESQPMRTAICASVTALLGLKPGYFGEQSVLETYKSIKDVTSSKIEMVTRGSATPYIHPNVGYTSPSELLPFGWYACYSDTTTCDVFFQRVFEMPVVLNPFEVDLQSSFLYSLSSKILSTQTVATRLQDFKRPDLIVDRNHLD